MLHCKVRASRVEPTLVNRREEIRQFNATSDRLWLFLSRGLFVCLGLIILATFLDYGLTYDEEVGSWYGRMVLKWYASFFKDQSALGYYDLHLYGGFFEATRSNSKSTQEDFAAWFL